MAGNCNRLFISKRRRGYLKPRGAKRHAKYQGGSMWLPGTIRLAVGRGLASADVCRADANWHSLYLVEATYPPALVAGQMDGHPWMVKCLLVIQTWMTIQDDEMRIRHPFAIQVIDASLSGQPSD